MLKRLQMVTLMIEIKGGNLQGVTSTEPIEYLLLDYDNLEAGDKPEVSFYGEDGIQSKEEIIKSFNEETKCFVED